MTGLRQDDPPRQNRRWRFKPAPERHPEAAFEGLRILEEVPGELGLALFQRQRDVALWAGTPPEARARLFASRRRIPFATFRSPVPEAVSRALDILKVVVQSPEGAGPQAVSKACVAVSDWAAERALLATAAEFAELAAYVEPEEPMWALAAGRIARKRAEYERAVTWLRRSISLARRSNRHSAIVAARISWATLELQRGNLDAAKSLLQKGWKKARKHKLKHLAARTQHDLLQVCLDTQEYEAAERHAAEAFRLYGPRADNILALAHDWASVWMRKEYFSAALPVLEAVAPSITEVHLRVVLLSSIALASGALGNRGAFDRAANEMRRIAATASENVPWALFNLSEGARSLGLVDDARLYAERARQLALGRDESVAAQAAAELLRKIEAGTAPLYPREPPPGSYAYEMAPRLVERVRNFAARS